MPYLALPSSSQSFALLRKSTLILLSLCYVAILLFLPARASAQAGSATLTGTVTDQSSALLRKAQVTVTNEATGVVMKTQTTGAGVYVVQALNPGSYRVLVEHQGFKQIEVNHLELHTQDVLSRNFMLPVGATSETVQVEGNQHATNDSPAVSMTVSREFVESMPLNGRSFQDLIQLAPGTVSAANGTYSIDGQRTDSNNYTVDGVSANLGGIVNGGETRSSGGFLGGAVGSQTALGTTQSLASVDSLQEFKIQTSGYAAEYGRNPGGQVQFTTRSGTNEFHGTLFEYFRNTVLDANSSYNNSVGLPQTAEHQNDFGGTFGGPLVIPRVYAGKNRTFYFLSYEGLRLLLPAHESENVPTQAFRAWAAPTVQPFLNAAPLPSPISLANPTLYCSVPNPLTTGLSDTCLFNYSYSYPNNLDNYSARIDHSFGARLHAFARYADTPSSVIKGAEKTLSSRVNVHTWTAGITTNISHNFLDDFRFNFSHDGEQSRTSQRSIGGSLPLPRSLVIPALYDGPYAATNISIRASGTSINVAPNYGGTGTIQHQYQIVDSLTWTKSSHTLKFGGDWRHLTPLWTSNPYSSSVNITSLTDIRNGNATSLQTSATLPGRPVFNNLSLYVQDHWAASTKLSIDYGLRWDFNPPPGPSNGNYPVALTSSDLATATLAPVGTQPYKTSYHSFGPRFGFAWNAIPTQRYALTIRGGFGIFFDTAQQVIGGAYANAYPFAAYSSVRSEIPLPLSGTTLTPPSLHFPLTPPYPNLNGLSNPDLTAPYTEQWNISLDESLRSNNTLSVSYLGNNGRKLIFNQFYGAVPGNKNFTVLNFNTNSAQSSYNALQVQDVGQIVNGLDVVASFTLAHALDDASNDLGNGSATTPLYGNSDFDLRRVLNVALNYRTAPAGWNGLVRSLTHGWLIANRLSIQSGAPLSVVQANINLPTGMSANYQPDLIIGVPLYLHGRASDLDGQRVPGSWRLNSAALANVPTGADGYTPIRQGTLGRNYLRTPSFWSLNTALQRNFPIVERCRLDLRVEAFNILNHPNYNEIDNFLSDSTFGTSNSVGGTIGSGNQLYGMGAARSLQLSLKLEF